MDKKINNFDFDFMPIGQAIKKAREAKKVTREQLAEIVDYSARHIQSVENEGQHPSFELFIQLITMFDVSVDEYIFPNKKTNKSSVRRRLETLLDNLDDKELSVIEATVNGLSAGISRVALNGINCSVLNTLDNSDVVCHTVALPIKEDDMTCRRLKTAVLPLTSVHKPL